MEVKIGVQHAQREITIDSTLDAESLEKAVEKAIKDGGLLTLSDSKGRRVVVPADRLAYVDIAHSATGAVGFRS
jgi:hypothetical protein